VAVLSERHEVRLRGRDHTIVFVADSGDGRLVIRQEPDGGGGGEVCAITLSDPEELRGFFEGLRRVLSSLPGGEAASPAPVAAGGRGPATPRPVPASAATPADANRDQVIAQARQRNAQAFAPWTSEEEQQVRASYESGETLPAIARVHRRSPRAIELRLQRMGVLPPDRSS
jgi:hypothetical protein